MSFLGVGAGVKAAAASYNPAAKFGVKVSEVEYRRSKAGRQLMARIYEPEGRDHFQPFSISHGGAWNAKDRKAETDGSRYSRKRRACRRRRPDARAGIAVSRVRAGCQLCGPLAQNESGVVERQPGEDRRLRQFERRPCCGVARHAAAGFPVQRDPVE